MKIVGVLADTKIDGAREPVKPTVYAYVPRLSDEVLDTPACRHDPQTLAFIDRTWHAFSPTVAIQRISWMTVSTSSIRRRAAGADVRRLCRHRHLHRLPGPVRAGRLHRQRRTKEIGIRKVFGARTRDVIFLLLWQFSIPVLIANVIAWPVAWYYLHGWLQGFAYRITLSPLYFLGAGAAALLIAWATVFAHARRVARANPIHALRYE